MNYLLFKSLAVVGLTLASIPLLTAQVYNANLIVNPGADASTGAISGWTSVSGSFQALSYGSPGGFPAATDVGPPDRGINFFQGGAVAFSEISQTLNLSSYHSAILLGTVDFALSAYFGGFATQDDFSTLTANFYSSSNALLASFTVGHVTELERGGLTGLLFRSINGDVPLTADSVTLVLDANRLEGSDNDGYADSLSFVLTVVPPPPPLPVPEPSTYGLIACAALGSLILRKRFARG